jgi:YidC/Oxa1 family membrane protein insertase
MFDPFFDAIAGLLAWFYQLPVVGGSYGAAIILLTLTVMVLVTPLTLKGTRSMMTMQALQPEIKRIQQDYADDRVRMNEELLAFYKENQINPVGGCLPLLLQMPVFILLYQVIQGLTRTDSDGYFDPKYLDPSSELYQDLHGSTEMVSWGLNLAQSAADALRISFVEGIPYIVLIALVASTSYIQQKQISGRNPNAEMPAQQKMLLRVMPVFFAFISFNFAAALVVYFLVSNLYRIGQQAYISKKIYGHDSMFGRTSKSSAIDTTATEASGGSKSSGTAIASKGKASDKGGTKGNASGDDASASRSRPPADKKPRPPSGRVTPPKSTGGNQQRRRKKRS